jgi:metal-responsive CopG/Arc/MetJ family transcriptional regulator
MAQAQQRPARSRPAAAKRGDKRTVVTFTVEPALLQKFDAAARDEERSRSSQIILLMRRWLEERRG